jgi:UPF0716 protein FxsA
MVMFLKLLLLFTLVPLAELCLLIQIGQVIGAEFTIAIVLITGIVGVSMAKSQGMAVLGRLQDQVAQGEVPGGALLDGAFVLVGGILLITPGLISDILGFLFLIPLTRGPIKALLRRKIEHYIAQDRADIRFRRW